jgi:hypothetical protein
LVPNATIFLTDLAEARAVAVQNISYANRGRLNTAVLSFNELDWEQPLYGAETVLSSLLHGGSPERGVDLVVAADCTYNADSRLVGLYHQLALAHTDQFYSPAFVNTMHQIALRFPRVVVAVAMKRRHSSEDVFFNLMDNAKFRITNTIYFPLPGDQKASEEFIELYIYQLE